MSKEHSREVRYDNVYNFFAYVKEISERKQRLRRPKFEIDKFSCLHGRDRETGIQLLDRKNRLSSFYNTVSYSNLSKVRQDYKDYLQRIKAKEERERNRQEEAKKLAETSVKNQEEKERNFENRLASKQKKKRKLQELLKG